MRKPVSRTIISWVILLAGAAIVFALCMRAAWISDDMDYGYVMTDDYIPILERVTGEETPQRISSWADIVQSQVVHYREVNGRAVAHTLIQWYCSLGGRTLFSLCNSAVFVAFILLVLWHGGGGTSNPRSVLTVVSLYFMSFVTHMTPAFQICYVWMFTLALLWLRFLFDDRRRSALMWPALFVLSMIAGCGNEALNIGLSVAIFIWWLRRVRYISARQYMLIIGFALGCAVLVFSPGNFGRASRNSSTFIGWAIIGFVYFTIPYVPAIIAIILWKKFRRKIPLREIYKDNSFWINLFLLCAILGIALGGWANRLFLGSALAALILTQRLLPGRGFNNFWLCVAAAGTAWIIAKEYVFVDSQRAEYERIRAEFIASDNGIVRTAKPTRRTLGEESFSYVMPVAESRMARAWRASLRSEFPQHAPLTLIPDVLPAVGDSVEAPFAVQLCEDVWLFVRPKGSDARFISHHSVGLGPLRRHYKSIESRVGEHVIDGGTWEAVYINSAYVWRTLGLDSVSCAPDASLHE